jgi:TonB-dependent Receptor Plug Domain
LASMNLEELMNIKVSSASKKVESLTGAPAAIYVITSDDLRRGGFSSVPDALRMVPGLHVAQQNAHVWIVAARGFSGLFNYITVHRGTSPAGQNVTAATQDPRQQVNVQSKFDLTQRLNLDAAYYYYDAIPHTLPPVNRVDVGLTSKPIRGFSFSVWGRNLQTRRHQEVPLFILPAGEIRRSIVFNLLWESSSDQGNGTL